MVESLIENIELFGPVIHQRTTTPIALAEAPQSPESSTLQPGRLFSPQLAQHKVYDLVPGTTRILYYRVILQGVDPWSACHITFSLRQHALPGDPHLFWQVPAQRRDFSTKAPLVSTGKTPQRHKHNVELSRIARKVDKPAKAFLGRS